MKILKIKELRHNIHKVTGQKANLSLLNGESIDIDNFNEDGNQPKEYTHSAIVEVNGTIGIFYGNENLGNTLKKLKLGWKWVG